MAATAILKSYIERYENKYVMKYKFTRPQLQQLDRDGGI
jgi:uncharacterized protein YbgA (DUF1722 family)